MMTGHWWWWWLDDDDDDDDWTLGSTAPKNSTFWLCAHSTCLCQQRRKKTVSLSLRRPPLHRSSKHPCVSRWPGVRNARPGNTPSTGWSPPQVSHWHSTHWGQHYINPFPASSFQEFVLKRDLAKQKYSFREICYHMKIHSKLEFRRSHDVPLPREKNITTDVIWHSTGMERVNNFFFKQTWLLAFKNYLLIDWRLIAQSTTQGHLRAFH